MPTNFHKKLIDLLQNDPRFVDEEGELVKAAVIDRAWKIDHDLVKRLIGNPEIKAKFFDEIEGHWVFNTNTFIDYISEKNFLANSYTRFRNKIGLNIDDKFLRQRGEVSLVWPYKDCVLEGGQTKEEEKRKEIFFNEILAQDEIDRLFDPKVLTNWKRHTVNGEEEVMGLRRGKDNTLRENLILKGNNLLTLHTLKKQFQGKIKLIYIDPPFNTGSDSFGYNDRFNHSSWLTFLRNRLEVAKHLLRKDGSIWINIDDDEAHYLKVMCDDVFGRENFVANMVWQKKYAASNDAKGIVDMHDHIFVYRKTEQFIRNLLPRTEKQNKPYKNDDGDGRGLWRSDNLLVKTFSTDYVFPIVNPKTGKSYKPREGSCWRANKKTINKWIKEKRIFFGKEGKGAPQLKRYLSEVQQGVVPNSWWNFQEAGHNDEAKKEIQRLELWQSDGLNFSTPKPERLLKRIIHIGSNEHDLVLDFFAGSGTTAAVAHKMNRQWIAVEQMDYIEDITVERLKKVIGKKVKRQGKLLEELEYDTGGISKSVGWEGGRDFVFCELMPYNEAFMDRIQATRSSSELVGLWRDISENSFLNWYVNPETPEDALDDFIAIGGEENGLKKQRKLLAELLDKNQLYVNLSEIDDEDFGISDEDKELNEEFYDLDPDEGLELRHEFVAELEQSIAGRKTGGKTTSSEKVAEGMGLDW